MSQLFFLTSLLLFSFSIHRVARIVVDYAPVLHEWSLELLDTVFVPKYVVKQLLLAMALETGVLTYRQLTVIAKALLSNFSSRSRLIASLERQQKSAESQDDWQSLAEAIDQAQGHSVWRSDPDCSLYEKDRITARIDEFIHIMRRRDIFELMFILRGGIARNKFGLLHEGLFSKALAGTKVLVETYHNVVCASLDFVCDAPVQEGEDRIPTDARLAFFNETRHAYGRTALILRYAIFLLLWCCLCMLVCYLICHLPFSTQLTTNYLPTFCVPVGAQHVSYQPMTGCREFLHRSHKPWNSSLISFILLFIVGFYHIGA